MFLADSSIERGMAGRRHCIALALLVGLSMLVSSARSDLVIARLDRRVVLNSHIVRAISSMKVENDGPNSASNVLLAFPNIQAKNLAYLKSYHNLGKGKGKGDYIDLPVEAVQPEGVPPELTFYSVSLPKELVKGESFNIEVLTVFTHALKPFPEEITQADTQLVVFQDSAYYLSPYIVKEQSLGIRVPNEKALSYTEFPNTKVVDSEIKYGPFENLSPYSYTPVVVHFENNYPFIVAEEVQREIEISHWGNVQITEHYSLLHGGARLKGGFSRIDYQSMPHIRGTSSFRHLIAKLPPRAHSIYYRDEIGNISTSHLWGDSKKTQLEIEPRFPMFGGWKTTFTIGYSLPLQDFLFESEGKRFLNITFGCSMEEITVDDLVIKVALPEGSKGISVSSPFPTKQGQEIKFSHLDILGRHVVVLEKKNVVPEHNIYFQVYYKFNSFSMLMEPMLLIVGFLFLFLTCIVYIRSDISISKSSVSYLAKQQSDEAQATIQQIQDTVNQSLAVHNKLEASLRDLSRTGDVQSCKAVRKAANLQFKDLAKDMKPLLVNLQSSQQSVSLILPKVEELLSKEKEMQEKLIQKHTIVVDAFEKKQSGRELDNRVAAIERRIVALKLEVDELLELLDEM